MCTVKSTNLFFFFFFFQAEDGIRDLTVTGVQTCALPILIPLPEIDHANRIETQRNARLVAQFTTKGQALIVGDRKSTRLNSSHSQISYAVFCLKKKNNFSDESWRRADYYRAIRCRHTGPA